MPRSTPLPPVAAVLSFIDAINRGDVDTLAALMTEDHRLLILDESPVVGREANAEAWRGYASAYPEYVIYPWRIATTGSQVAVLGTTTGSHLGLLDEQELALRVIWLAEVADGRLATWQIVEDTAEARERYGLDAPL